MEFDINNINEIKKLARIVRKAGYFNTDEHLDDVTEKVAYVLATSNILNRCRTKTLLIRALADRLNSVREFRETEKQNVNRYNMRRERAHRYAYGEDRPNWMPVMGMVNIESGFDVDDGDVYNDLEPMCQKSNADFARQMREERECWTTENLRALFRYFLKKTPDEAGLSESVRRKRQELFNKTLKATWGTGGRHLKLYKRARHGLVLDETNEWFGKNACEISAYLKRLSENVKRADGWRSYLNRFREDHVYRPSDWEYPLHLTFQKAVEALSEPDRELIESWLDYKVKLDSYEQLRACYSVYEAVSKHDRNT